MSEWSAPDARGVRVLALDVGAQSTLRGRRIRKVDRLHLAAAGPWPEDWKQLARDWLGGKAEARWTTLQGKAGHMRTDIASDLMEALLLAGWIELHESREPGRWVPMKLRFIDLEAQRECLGLSNRHRLQQQRDSAFAHRFSDATLQAAAEACASQAIALALRRHRWLLALERWQTDGRSGTRRDFALFAAHDTKGVPEADWRWLETTISLSAFAIELHTPLLLIRAPLRLTAVPDFIGLTPETVRRGSGLEGQVSCWRLVENRTSFERVARRFGADEGVIWLPGYPPEWWRACVQQLLRLHPAPALIACDPDPAGIEIALYAGALWDAEGLAWSAWKMEAGVLDELPTLKALTEDDHQRLARLMQQNLPDPLNDLAAAMLQRGVKGEQEGLADL